MGERKVLNKYYPPDFDPSKIPRRKQPKNKQMTVRMMLPMSIRCNTCGNYIYKGTKFNSRKEDAEGENYLGIQIVRFYFKCTKCSAELTMKTDPRNSDYTVEAGASRNFEPWRGKDEEIDKETKKREAEEMGDTMKSLENRTLDSKREMDIMSALDEMKSMKSRHATVSVDDMLKALQRTGEEEEDPDLEQKLDEADEALIKSIFHAPKEFVKRIDDGEWDDDEGDDNNSSKDKTTGHSVKRQKVSEDAPTDILANSNSNGDIKNSESSSSKPIVKTPAITFKVKKKETVEKKDKPNNSSVLNSLAQYDSDDDDD